MDSNHTFSSSERARFHQILDYLLDQGYKTYSFESAVSEPDLEGVGTKHTKYSVKIEVKKDIVYSVF